MFKRYLIFSFCCCSFIRKRSKTYKQIESKTALNVPIVIRYSMFGGVDIKIVQCLMLASLSTANCRTAELCESLAQTLNLIFE